MAKNIALFADLRAEHNSRQNKPVVRANKTWPTRPLSLRK
jgi:hypothetical protein